MNGLTNVASLPRAQERLIKLMQRVYFGRIEQLEVRAGQPVLHPPPRVVRERKLGAERPIPGQHHFGAFSLKSQVVELLNELTLLGNGIVDCIQIKHGLPFTITISDAAIAREDSTWSR